MTVIKCEVVSASGAIFAGSANMVIASSIAGELGILKGHSPLVTLLKPAPVRLLQQDGSEEVIYVSGGVMEVQPHVVTILADSATRATDIDEAAVLEAKRNAELLLSNNKGDIDSAAAMAALAESVAQIQTLNKLKNKA